MERVRERLRALTIAVLFLLVAVTAVFTSGIFSARGKAVAQAAEFDPIAKYEFKDDSNHGKDSMGNYHLSAGEFWAPATPYPATGTGTIANGAITFDGDDGLTVAENSNLSSSLSAFTLTFEAKLPDDKIQLSDWSMLLGFNDFNADNFFHINIGQGSDILRLSTSAWGGGEKFWGPELGKCDEAFHRFTISVNPGGLIKAYYDGKIVASATKPVAADWRLPGNGNRFGIGAAFSGLASYATTCSLKNVRIYDFAMTEDLAKAYHANDGFITQAEVTADNAKKVKSVSEPAFEGGVATSAELNAGMSEAEMLLALNKATVTVTYSDDKTTENVSVNWKSIAVSGTTYKAIGDLAMIEYPFEGNVEYTLAVSSLKGITAPTFEGAITSGEIKSTMTDEEMLAKVNPATVIVSYADDTQTEPIALTWTSIRADRGNFYAVADVKVGATKVGVAEQLLPVVKDNTGDNVALEPIAKYDFSDTANPGKDSKGNFNLRPALSPGGGEMGGGTVQDGKLYLNGGDCLTLDEANDFSEFLTGFTLSFQFMMDASGDQPDWLTPVGFGFNDWNAVKFGNFLIPKGSTDLRFNMNGMTYAYENETLKPQAYWGPVVAQQIDKKMQNITLSIMPGGEAFILANGIKYRFPVYPDGHEPETDPYVVPADWNISHSNMQFALGGSVAWGNAYSTFKGWIDNVELFDFAMDEQQALSYWRQGEIRVSDMGGKIITAISKTPVFKDDEVTSAELKDTQTVTQMLKRVNEAVLTATFKDETTIDLPVSWETIENENGVYTLVGSLKKFGLGYACSAEKEQIRLALQVTKVERDVVVSESITNGTVTPDKDKAFQGDKVTFTVTPESGYKISKLMVNDEEVQPVDGVYSAVMGADGMTVTAEFEKLEASGGGCGGCGSSALSVGSGMLVVLLAIAAVLIMRRKKSVKS